MSIFLIKQKHSTRSHDFLATGKLYEIQYIIIIIYHCIFYEMVYNICTTMLITNSLLGRLPVGAKNCENPSGATRERVNKLRARIHSDSIDIEYGVNKTPMRANALTDALANGL